MLKYVIEIDYDQIENTKDKIKSVGLASENFMETSIRNICEYLNYTPKNVRSNKYLHKLKHKLQSRGLAISITHMFYDDKYKCEIILKKFEKSVDISNFMVYNVHNETRKENLE